MVSAWDEIAERLGLTVGHQVIVRLIGATTTKTGLSVACRIDGNLYPNGVTVSDDDINAINLVARHIPWRMELCDLAVTRLRMSLESMKS